MSIKYSHNIFIFLPIFLSMFLLSACFSNWRDLDAFVAQIKCDNAVKQISQLAKSEGLGHEWDEINYVLSVYKDSDALAALFNKQGKLLTISVLKSDIKLLGLFRRQGEAVIALNCHKSN